MDIYIEHHWWSWVFAITNSEGVVNTSPAYLRKHFLCYDRTTLLVLRFSKIRCHFSSWVRRKAAFAPRCAAPSTLREPV